MKKNIWQIQNQTVCKVIGMALTYKDLKKIAVKFGMSPQDALIDHEFILHSTAVHVCASDNRAARYIQKMIEERFLTYSKRLATIVPSELISTVGRGDGIPGVPLWAILWQLATQGLEHGSSVETALFGHIHMLEHRLLKAFWDSPCAMAEKSEEEALMSQENKALRRRVLDLQRELRQSVKSGEKLRRQLSKTMTSQLNTISHPFAATMGMDESRTDRSDKVKRLYSLLEASRVEKQNLEEECVRLRLEVDAMVRDASLNLTKEFSGGAASCPPECPLRNILQGKHIAMVGGIGSLEAHYRSLVDEMGATFDRHDGDCRGGVCFVEDCVKRSDLVVCPIDVNSHNAVKAVKKICKSYGVPCCFPRSAGLTGLRHALEAHCAQSCAA